MGVYCVSDATTTSEESWRPVKRAAGRYEVSDAGRVRGPSGKVLKPTLMEIGYYSVALSLRNHKVIRQYVHRLVAEAFIGPVEGALVVNHRNGDKRDNRLANLEVISRAGNGLQWAATGRSVKAGRKRTGFCGRGHPLPENTTACLECQRLKKAGHVFNPPEDTEWRTTSVSGYLVSSDGRVWSTKTNRVIRPGVNRSGYCYVNIRDAGRTRPISVHRLVAEAFIGPVNTMHVIDHINGDKKDNRAANLRALTRSDNIRAFRDTMRATGRHGLKFDEQTIAALKWLLTQGHHRLEDLATQFGMSRSHVYAIAQGHKWSHVQPLPPTAS